MEYLCELHVMREVMTIRFVSSVTFTQSYLPSHQTGSELWDGDSSNSRCSFSPVGVSVVNIALQSAVEIEATWPRPEELGSAPVEKHNTERGPCNASFTMCPSTAMWNDRQCHPKAPRPFSPLWPVRAERLVGSQFETDWEMTFWNFPREDGRVFHRRCFCGWPRRY